MKPVQKFESIDGTIHDLESQALEHDFEAAIKTLHGVTHEKIRDAVDNPHTLIAGAILTLADEIKRRTPK
jgi:hypothetical protein